MEEGGNPLRKQKYMQQLVLLPKSNTRTIKNCKRTKTQSFGDAKTFLGSWESANRI